MSLSPISFTSQSYQAWQASMSQRREDFQSLASSLQSGDLSGAQQAYSAMESTFPNANSPISAASSTGTSASGAASSVQQEFAALGQDLSSGNLTQAQQDFTQLQDDFQAAISQNGGSVPDDYASNGSSQSSAAQSNGSSSGDLMSLLASNLLAQYGSPNGTSSSTTSNILNLIG